MRVGFRSEFRFGIVFKILGENVFGLDEEAPKSLGVGYWPMVKHSRSEKLLFALTTFFLGDFIVGRSCIELLTVLFVARKLEGFLKCVEETTCLAVAIGDVFRTLFSAKLINVFFFTISFFSFLRIGLRIDFGEPICTEVRPDSVKSCYDFNMLFKSK